MFTSQVAIRSWKGVTIGCGVTNCRFNVGCPMQGRNFVYPLEVV